VNTAAVEHSILIRIELAHNAEHLMLRQPISLLGHPAFPLACMWAVLNSYLIHTFSYVQQGQWVKQQLHF
jgi:hypothetical protein